MKNRQISHSAALLSVLAAQLFLCLPTVVYAQDAFSRAKAFYESADYEEALQVLDTLKGKTSNSDVAAYRVFCLVALGRQDEAKVAVETIVRADPLFRPAEGQVSPRLRSFFMDSRKPLLPEIARLSYGAAKGAYDRKEWAPALAEFDRVLSLLDEIGGTDQGVADLRTLAGGFRDLAKTALEPPKKPEPAPTPTPMPTPVAPLEPSIYGIQHTDVKKPITISQTMPAWTPESPAEKAMSFEGAVEVVVNEEGKVLSVKIIDSVHPRYDQQLLKAAVDWTFRPATKNGVAVKFRYIVSIRLGW